MTQTELTLGLALYWAMFFLSAYLVADFIYWLIELGNE